MTDENADALESVEVIADASMLFDTRSQMTGADGTTVLLGLPPGSYRLEISRDGYQWMEIHDVRCQPFSVVRLPVVLERVEGDEMVILPSGPSVDVESTTVGYLRPLESWKLLPAGIVDASLRAELRPIDALAFGGIIEGGQFEQPGHNIVLVPSHPEKDIHGRASIDAGVGLKARPTGTRGEVTSLDSLFRTRFSIGGIAGESRIGTFFALEADAADLQSQVEISDSRSHEDVGKRRKWDQDSVFAVGALDWMPTSANRLGLRLNWGRARHEDVPSTLHVIPEAPIPGGDRDQLNGTVQLAWNWLARNDLALRVVGAYSDKVTEWVPAEKGLMAQDQSAEGSWTGGLGNGIWSGDGGVAAFDKGREDFIAEAAIEGYAGSGHRLGLESSWHRQDSNLQYSSQEGGVGLGVRRTHRGPVATRTDSLAAVGVNQGLLESGRILLRDHWRAASNLTIVLGLEIGDLRFDAGGDRQGYHFGVADSLSPRIGFVWDFEGAGRSRTWVRWARFRQGPDEAVRWRLTGAIDIETVFIDDDASLWTRPPGAIAVASGLDLGLIDEAVFGVEYEILSHLVIGAAGAIRRSRGELAILTEDDGLTMELDTPSGHAWSEDLERDSQEAWGWVRRRLANGWQGELVMRWRRSQGVVPATADFDLTELDREYLADVISPAALEHASGALPDDRRWHIEASGSWRFSAGPSLGGRLSYKSGAPVSRLGALADGLGLDRRFVGNRGSGGRTPSLLRMDAIGSWPIEVGSGDLEIVLEFHNLLNSQRALSLDERWTVLDENQAAGLSVDEERTQGTWGQPIVVQRPLEARIGLVYSW